MRSEARLLCGEGWAERSRPVCFFGGAQRVLVEQRQGGWKVIGRVQAFRKQVPGSAGVIWSYLRQSRGPYKKEDN